MTAATANRRQCPNCRVTLTRYEWSRLWWMSTKMSGRLVQPCTECGARLRLSSMALLTTLSAFGLITTAMIYVFYQDNYLLWIALVFLLLMLIAMLATRLEAVPGSTLPPAAVPPPRNEPPRV
jgi:hypothetical protein